MSDVSALLIDDFWIRKFEQYDCIKVGVSAGLDSMVLLHYLASIKSIAEKILVVHVNHGLSSNSNSWQDFCETYCLQRNIPIVISRLKLNVMSNIEERARDARYQVFKSVLVGNDCLVLAHHCNDQAETLLLNLLRGSGVDGLAAMPKIRQFGKGYILRPFLNNTRDSLHKYATDNNLTWMDDESNANLDYSRNFLRQVIIPKLLEKWPNAVGNISSCADNCFNARSNLDSLALIDCPSLVESSNTLYLGSLVALSRQRICNILRLWFKNNDVLSPSAKIYAKLVEEVIFARIDKLPEIRFGEIIIRRYKNNLYLLRMQDIIVKSGNNMDYPNYYKDKDIVWKDFPKSFYLPDGRKINANLGQNGISIRSDSRISIKFRRGGESFRYNGQTKKLKKIMQELAIVPWERDTVPLLYVDDELRSIVGFLLADDIGVGELVYNFSVEE